MAFTQGRALLIGVDLYKHKPELDVPQTANDIRALADVLQNPQYCGYPADQVQVLTGEQATRANMLAAFEKLADETQATDTVIVFYAGHGFFSHDTKYHLSCYDSSFEAEYINPGEGIAEAELVQALRFIKSQRLLLIVNACYSGNMSRSLSGEQPSEGLHGQPLPMGLANALLSAGEGRAIITACRSGQKAYFSDNKDLTYFGEELINGLKGNGTNNNGFVGLFDLYAYLYHSLTSSLESLNVKQEPELTILKGVGPFPLALFMGAKQLGAFKPEDEALLKETAVRRVSPAYSQSLVNRYHNVSMSGNARAGVVISGDSHGLINYTDRSTNTNVSGIGNAVGPGARSHVVDTGGGAYSGRDQNNFSGPINDSVLNIGSTVTNSNQSINSQRGTSSPEQQLRSIQQELLKAVNAYQPAIAEKVKRYSDDFIETVIVSPIDSEALDACRKLLLRSLQASPTQVTQPLNRLLEAIPAN